MNKKFRYCPQCGNKLADKTESSVKRRYCLNCRRFYYNNPLVGVAVLAEKNSRMLFVKRKVMPARGMWALPGGFVEQGESIEKAALRELREETGLTGKNPEIISIFTEAIPFLGTIVVLGVAVKSVKGRLKAGDDAEDAVFFEKNKEPVVVFTSHKKFIKKYRKEKGAVN